jgi:hypothetical protein
MPHRSSPSLAGAIASAKQILARAEALDALPPKLREAMLCDPEGLIYQADRDVAVRLLARFVAVIEQIDPEVAMAAVDLARLERAIAEEEEEG